MNVVILDLPHPVLEERVSVTPVSLNGSSLCSINHPHSQLVDQERTLSQRIVNICLQSGKHPQHVRLATKQEEQT